MTTRRRIRVKTTPKPTRGRKKGSKKDGPTALDDAIKSGLVPKARNAYALFTFDELKKPQYSGKAWPARSKQIASAWKVLPPEQKAVYSGRASEEKQKQHAVMIELGLRRPREVVATQVRETNLGQVRFGTYILLQQNEIGRGSYGQVVVAKEERTERRVALKVFQSVDEARQEIAMYEHLWSIGGNRCILPLLHHFATPPTPFLSMPFCLGANLRQLLRDGNIGIEMQNGMVAQFAEAVAWLQSCHVAHLDLKPGNVLWDPRCCNLIVVDFGMSLKLQEDGKPAENIAPFVGVTPNYRPPELWAKQVSNDTLCKPVDVWSFGVIVVEIYSQRMLFEGDCEHSIRTRLNEWKYSWMKKHGRAQIAKVPPHLRNVVWFCWSPEPALRPRMQEDVTTWGSQLPPCPMKC